MPAAGSEKRPFNIEQYTRIIERLIPDLQGADVRRVNEEGQHNDAFFVDEAFIRTSFRSCALMPGGK